MLRCTYNGHQYHYFHIVHEVYGACYEHECEKPDGQTISIDCDPLTTLSLHSFKLWVDLGCPDRYSLNIIERPINSDDLAMRWDKVFAKPITM
ncbi:MAG: hypothetical protein EOO38_23765 [Cytophagaceae bacterium]|nr:MAG: hypothetical protein EOO38_23765 [Cytophagaceae bacterium]